MAETVRLVERACNGELVSVLGMRIDRGCEYSTAIIIQ